MNIDFKAAADLAPIVDLVAFGVRDRLGREIGARLVAQVGTAEFGKVSQYQPNGAGYSSLADRAPGSPLVRAYFQATRGGKTYGASQPPRFFSTIDEAREAFAAYLVDARKRAGK